MDYVFHSHIVAYKIDDRPQTAIPFETIEKALEFFHGAASPRTTLLEVWENEEDGKKVVGYYR